MNSLSRLCLTLLALSAAPGLPITAAQAADPAFSWKVELGRPVRWFKPSSSGVLLVGTDREILGVSSDSGKVLWRVGPIRDSNANDVEVLGHSTMALLSAGLQDSSDVPPLSLIQLRDGHTLWTRTKEELLRSVGSFLVPGTDNLLVRATTSSSDSKKTAMLVNAASGHIIWTNEALGEDFEPVFSFWFESCVALGHQAPFRDTDSSMIFHMRDGMFQRIDLTTGALVWTARGENVISSTSDSEHRPREFADRITYNPNTERIEFEEDSEEDEEDENREMPFQFAPMVKSSAGDHFYAPYQKSVAAFALASGECLWRDPPDLDGVVLQMEEIPGGLLVRTVKPSGKEFQHRVLLLDSKTGEVRQRWPEGGGVFRSGSWSDATNFIVEKDRVVIAAEGKLRILNVADGKEQTLGKLKFDGIDAARTLQRVSTGYAVIGRCNLGIYSSEDGKRTKHYFRRPPDTGGWGLALLGVSAITGGLVPPDLGFDVFMLDLSSSEESERYVYFVTKTAKGPGIIRVSRETCEPAGLIFWGKRIPGHVIDAEGRIYFRFDSKTLHCWRY